MSRSTAIACAAIAPLALAGCQMISGSSDSISDSLSRSSTLISAPFKASSESSGSEGDDGDDGSDSQTAYRTDVRVATRAFVESQQGAEEFVREIGRIAEQHGITDWEGRPETLVGIGAGARQAGLDETGLDALLRQLGLARDDERARARDGWRSAAL